MTTHIHPMNQSLFSLALASRGLTPVRPSPPQHAEEEAPRGPSPLRRLSTLAATVVAVLGRAMPHPAS